jgi:hypothetical protein
LCIDWNYRTLWGVIDTDQRALDGAAAVLSAVLVVFSLVFAGATVTWFAFALALGWVGVAIAGLTLHEIETWRSAHELGELHWLVGTSRTAQDQTATQPSLSQAA